MRILEPDRHGERPETLRPAYSRALLLPGPLPPLSHFGVTLLRHAVATGLRYSLYHLGLPLPEAPPVKIVRLRLYLDARALRPLLADAPGGPDVIAALLEPGETGKLPAAARSLSAALSFHRVRLYPIHPGSRLGRLPALTGDEAPAALWQRIRKVLTHRLPRLNDALLADLISSIERRALRARGEEVPPALSHAAWKLRTGGRASLHLFGLPDPVAPSWAESPGTADSAREALAPHPLPGHDRFRGRFREAYRAMLDHLSPLYREIARKAADRGLLDSPADAFFLPFDVAGDLIGDGKPAWLADAVRNNRAEYDSLRRAAEPLDVMSEQQEMGPVPEGKKRPEWDLGPLLPLP